MGHARLAKRDNESDHQAFARIVDGDIDIRRALLKSGLELMPTEPLVTGGADATDVNSASKAYDQIQELASEMRRRSPELRLSQQQAFSRALQDPANRELAARALRRPTASSTSGSELQR